jgi:hypothetical protein
MLIPNTVIWDTKNVRNRTRKKRLKKSKNVFNKCVLDLNFALIKVSVFFIFKKKSNSLYPIDGIFYPCCF